MHIYQTYKYAVFCIEVYMSEQKFKKWYLNLCFIKQATKITLKKTTTVIQGEKKCDQNTKHKKRAFFEFPKYFLHFLLPLEFNILLQVTATKGRQFLIFIFINDFKSFLRFN